ncbi:MAG: sulfatase [Planctomycetes bacterium]|nr:sulfatase [Planctomycetota bacterium]
MRLAALLLLALCACAPAHERPNVLLVSIDTLRADRLPQCEQLQEFARDALVFENAQSPRAKTTPALASLLTGLYPHEHGVRELLQPLSPRIPVLAERLRAAGWSTAAIVGNWVLGDARSGLARGFEQWTEDLPDVQRVPPDDVPERRARSLTDGALVALGLEPWKQGDPLPRASALSQGKPWFLWLHYMDPHGSYDPPQEFRRAAAAPDPIDESGEDKPSVAQYNVPASARLPDGRIDAAAVRALYDGEVRYVDHELGRLFGRMRAAGLLENTIVVVTADHGESLGEQQYYFEHGRNVSQACCAVPLLVRVPRGARGREARPVSLCDVEPMLLGFLGLGAAPLAGGPVFCEKIERPDLSKAIQEKAVRLGDWKYVRRYAQVFDAATPENKQLVIAGEELYDLAADPREEHDLSAAPPKSAPLARLQAELLRFSAADVRFGDLATRLAAQRAELEASDPETLRILKALGY